MIGSVTINPTENYKDNSEYRSLEPLIWMGNPSNGQENGLGREVKLFSAYQTRTKIFNPLFLTKLRGYREHPFAVLSQDLLYSDLVKYNSGNREQLKMTNIRLERIFSFRRPFKKMSSRENFIRDLNRKINENVHAAALEYAESYAVHYGFEGIVDNISGKVIDVKDTPTYIEQQMRKKQESLIPIRSVA